MNGVAIHTESITETFKFINETVEIVPTQIAVAGYFGGSMRYIGRCNLHGKKTWKEAGITGCGYAIAFGRSGVTAELLNSARRTV